MLRLRSWEVEVRTPLAMEGQLRVGPLAEGRLPRRTFGILISVGALVLVAVLCVAGVPLLWGRSYTHDQVSSQLAAQKIFFPPANSPAIAAPEFAPMHQ
jgi:hypothetical protein